MVRMRLLTGLLYKVVIVLKLFVATVLLPLRQKLTSVTLKKKKKKIKALGFKKFVNHLFILQLQIEF